MGRQEFEDLVVRQLEAYTEKPADIHDLRNACRHVLSFSLSTWGWGGGALGGGWGEQGGGERRQAHVVGCEPAQFTLKA